MTATTTFTALATVQPMFTDSERLALAGFLAGYRGLTREARTLDLCQFTAWCRIRSLSLFSVRRADIETFARDLEAKGRARATVTRRLDLPGWRADAAGASCQLMVDGVNDQLESDTVPACNGRRWERGA
jgi:hypothetical protein